MRQESRTQLLYITPGEELTITVNPGNQLMFAGKTVPYQEFLQDYFLENHYQYLPAFRFDPRKIDNPRIIQQSDSLAQLRKTKYEELRATLPIDEVFDNYVRATTHVELYQMRVTVRDREIRQNTPVRLTPAQRKELDQITLSNFKLFPDEALLSLPYWNELQSWILTPITEKYPPSKANQYLLDEAAVSEAYTASTEKLREYPKQQQYMNTYWLNYAVTALPSVKVAKSLFADFRERYPDSPVKEYFSKLISAKEKLEKGEVAPDFTLLNADSTAVSLSSLRGKPLCVAFAFNLKQHEPALRLVEDVKGDSVLFVYISVAPGIPFSVVSIKG
jgi:hypothetical protein